MPSKAGPLCAGDCSNTHTDKCFLSFPQTCQLRQTYYRQESHRDAGKENRKGICLRQRNSRRRTEVQFPDCQPSVRLADCTVRSLCVLVDQSTCGISGGRHVGRGIVLRYREAAMERGDWGKPGGVPRGALLFFQAVKLQCIFSSPPPSPPNPKEVLAIQATMRQTEHGSAAKSLSLFLVEGEEKKVMLYG